MIQAPCKNCQHRKMKCHSSCKRWIKYKTERDKEREIINTEKKREQSLTGFAIDNAIKTKKQRRTGK